ncbi:MAG: alanine:cation symporter family protein [Rikenellaceae bacterium]|nr:alanine:cation symporter family protein [Rikenellaceae bacterium]
MELFNQILNSINDALWGYVMIAALIACALYFTIRTRFVQFRLIGDMFRQLFSSNKAEEKSKGKKRISSFQAFAVSLASHVGVGNLAGVASAISIGGPGAVFWMWVIALLGAANSFIENTLAQLYKVRDKESFVGGPAYYITRGLKCRWMAILFCILTVLTFGFAYNTVQSNTLCSAIENAFGINHIYVGIAITVGTLIVIFGGIQRIAKVSSLIVPFMAIGYLILALYVVLANITIIPEVISTIVKGAFGIEQALGGTIGAAMMQGIKRGLFSNEAGEGSAPNAAATADVSHPVKQGLLQMLGVFTDTLVICSCTAFIILVSGLPLDGSLDGVLLTQEALSVEIGHAGRVFVAIAIFFFAFSSIIGNYYYGEANIAYISKKRWAMTLYRLIVGAMVMFGAVTTLQTVWSLADLTMALMTLCNLVAIVLLGRRVIVLLDDYMRQRRAGKDPVFRLETVKDKIPTDGIECW